MKRLATLRDAAAGKAPALLTRPVSIRYLTGLEINPHERLYCLLVPVAGTPVLFVPALDLQKAKDFDGEVVPVPDEKDPADLLRPFAPREKALYVEKSDLSLSRLELFQRAWGDKDLLDLDPVITGLRETKDEDELQKIRRAAQMIDRTVAEAKGLLREGMTERELAFLVERFMTVDLGAGPSFRGQILFGAHTALPHGMPTERPLARGDLVLFDIGALFEGYASDITRTFFFEEATPEARDLYDLVYAAHEAAAEKLAPGVPAQEVDQAARAVIERGGHGPHFIHRVGHGLGLEVHESPSMTGSNPQLLRTGMVVTIEPGIYLPGVGGVRIEDDYLITKDGAEKLTRSPRHAETLMGLRSR